VVEINSKPSLAAGFCFLYNTHMAGYHITKIEKGVLGTSSKIKEELEELLDSEFQNNPVMALVELADMLGAIESYLEHNHPSITLENIITMKNATRRAFEGGQR